MAEEINVNDGIAIDLEGVEVEKGEAKSAPVAGDMAEKPDWVYLQIPMKLSSKEDAKDNLTLFTTKDGKELASLKMPGGLKVKDIDGVEQDISFFQLITTEKSVKESYDHDDTFAIAMSTKDLKDPSKAWNVKLTRRDGHRDQETGEFVVDQEHEVHVDPFELADALADRAERMETRVQGAYLHVPEKTRDGAPYVKTYHDSKPLPDGSERTRNTKVTLPAHTFVEVDGQKVDLSFAETWVTEKSVHPDKFHEGYLTVFVPTQNKDGEPLPIFVNKDAWLKDGNGEPVLDEQGNWVKDEANSLNLQLSPEAVAQATKSACFDRAPREKSSKLQEIISSAKAASEAQQPKADAPKHSRDEIPF